MGKSKDLATGNSAAYVETGGDTMTGALNINAENTKISHSTNHLILHDTSETDTGSNWWYMYRTTGDGKLRFYRGSDKLIIDGSGAVSMPHQPAFRAYLSTEWTTTGAYVSSGWTENYDRNNDFNQGTFTAPVAGVYHFTVNWDANASQSQLHLYHNSNYTYRREPTGRTDDNWESYGYSVDVKMAANDYVKLYLETGSGGNPIHMGGGYWGNFQGHLIG